MKKLSLLFAFVGFFALTNVSAQSAKCCTFPDGTCVLCPEGSATCSAKAVKSCSVAEVAACKKMVANEATKPSCQKAENTAMATTVANKSKAEVPTCCGIPISCCSKGSGKATQTSNATMASNKPTEKACGSLPVGCSKAKATKTAQLAEKMD